MQDDDKSAVRQHQSNAGESSYLTSEYGASMPELSLEKCSKYTIAKDSFTEIVLLTVIAYFCVSTEQRFINMSMEKDKNSGSEPLNKSGILNNSNRSLPQSNLSSGIHSAGLNTTLQTKSTKAQSSLLKNSITETKIITL